MSDEVSVTIATQPALKFGFCQLTKENVSIINDYIDNNIENLDDHSDQLVGQIKQNNKSSQLALNMKDKVPHQFGQFLIKAAKKYASEHNISAKRYEITQMWSVHSYAGDYNPLHEHGTMTGRAISCILFLKVPPQIGGTNSSVSMAAMSNNSGSCDGWTQFIWGASSVMDKANFKHSTEAFIKPEVGKLVMFPIWLKHQVMPFFGEGERRSLSANIDIHV